jgi:lipopolysaccharide cholinephosphotransferase
LLNPEESIYPMLKIINKKTYLLEFPNSIKNEIGIYIDVFPKDGLPSNKFLSFVLCKSVRTLILLNWFVKVSIYKWKDDEKLFKRVLSFVGRAFVNKNNKNIFQKLLTKIAKMYKFENSKYVSTIIAGGMKNTVLKEYLNNYKLHEFENLYLNIPKGWDEYLTKLYGDYMQIPDKSQRGKHDYIAYELS